MTKYIVTMVVRGIIEAEKEESLWERNFNLTDVSHAEILDVEEVGNAETNLGSTDNTLER